MNVLGTHLLLELRECNPAFLDDIDYVKDAMVSAARVVEAQIIGESFHRFKPQGVTGVLAIAESHLSIHTWPEHNKACIDLFTCKHIQIDDMVLRNIVDSYLLLVDLNFLFNIKFMIIEWPDFFTMGISTFIPF